MNLFAKLRNAFAAGDAPEREIVDALLGTIRWAEDDEAWLGEYNGQLFSLAYERTSRPDPELTAYARSILEDAAYVSGSFEKARDRAKTEMGGYTAEIDGLRLGRLHFFQNRGRLGIFGHLDGGRDHRVWRIEYTDRTCHGIGFDS